MVRFSNTLKFRLALGLFFLALSVPSVILVNQAYSQLKWEAFYQHRTLAEELSARINRRFGQLITTEESRAFGDYSFLVVSGVPEANYLQPSPLSRYPANANFPGLLGYFQIDAKGQFTTPLLPQPAIQAASYGIPTPEIAERQNLQAQIFSILRDNQLVQPRLEQDQLGMSKPTAPESVTSFGARRVEMEGNDEMAASLPAEIARLEEVVANSSASAQGARTDKAEAFTFNRESPVDFERLKGNQAGELQQQKLDALSSYGRVEDLKLRSRYDHQQSAAEASTKLKKRAARKEQSAVPMPQAAPEPALYDQAPTEKRRASADTDEAAATLKITIFESEIDPFDFALMDSGHFVIYRNVWRNGRRLIQGAIIEQQAFLKGLIEAQFRETGLSQMSDLLVAYQGSVFSAFGGISGRGYLSLNSPDANGELLYQTRLSAPFSDLELLFSINHLPTGQGAAVVGWTALILAAVLLGGLLLMYRLGARQISLARQQQDFVSAVSHELKTPLTSIRMYSEMLREGWADADKRKRYYDFIFEESERLSRLIANVLQLARMNRNDIQLDLKPYSIQTLFDNLHSKLGVQIDNAGFTLTLTVDPSAQDAVVKVDVDAFTQILINLVDNAIKFSAKAKKCAVEISASLSGHNSVIIAVRDYGPGVPKNQMKKIFRLFYRSETELTRETVGTGIGLALVHQQLQAMGGKVDVLNRDPGAEFRLTLPLG